MVKRISFYTTLTPDTVVQSNLKTSDLWSKIVADCLITELFRELYSISR